jgi:hypothetical protein
MTAAARVLIVSDTHGVLDPRTEALASHLNNQLLIF